MNVRIQNLKFVALTVPEIIGGTLTNLPNFSWAFVQMDPVNVAAKYEVRSFTHS